MLKSSPSKSNSWDVIQALENCGDEMGFVPQQDSSYHGGDCSLALLHLILVISDISTLLLTMTRLFLTPSCSHSSFPRWNYCLLKYSHPLPFHCPSAMRHVSVLPAHTTPFQNWDAHPSFLTIPAVFHISRYQLPQNTLPDSPAPKGTFSTLLPYKAAAHSFPPHLCPYKISSFFSGDRKKN